MVQYLITSLAAIIGATIILIQSFSLMPMIFAAIFLFFIFCVTSYHRACRLRNIITQTRLARHLIRSVLDNGNVKHALLLVEIDRDLTGFSLRIKKNMIWLALFCGLVGASLFAIGGIILSQETNLESLVSVNGLVIFVIAMISGYLIFCVLRRELRKYNQISNKLLKDHNIDVGESELPTIRSILTLRA